jgi:hypothetical protein
MLDPRDYIDPDEGRDDPFFTYAPEVCVNCLRSCERLTWIPGFNYFGCDDCASEAKIMVFAEENCPALYRCIVRAKRVSEVQRAFRWHKETCERCNPKLAARREAGQETTPVLDKRWRAA